MGHTREFEAGRTELGGVGPAPCWDPASAAFARFRELPSDHWLCGTGTVSAPGAFGLTETGALVGTGVTACPTRSFPMFEPARTLPVRPHIPVSAPGGIELGGVGALFDAFGEGGDIVAP